MDDPRLGSLVERRADASNLAGVHVALIGFPYDEGCRRNGGRVGAADGPAVFRPVRAPVARLLPIALPLSHWWGGHMQMMLKTGTVRNPEFNIDVSKLRVVDLGDVEPGLELEAAHERLAQLVERVAQQGSEHRGCTASAEVQISLLLWL